MRKFVPAVAGLAALCALTGCESVWSSIYRETNLNDGGGRTLVTDAKQRAIINVSLTPNPRDPNNLIRTRIICAEPSPDVAQAISASLQIAASVKTGVDTIGGNLGLATAASVAQLGERLAVIQLLRDKMYRACEAYANGATSKVGYTLMLARLDKTMTTLLAAEMAAGAFGRNLAQIGSSASGSSTDLKNLEERREQVTKALKEVNEASDKVAALKADASAEDRAKTIGEFQNKSGALSAATQALLEAERSIAVSASAGTNATNPGAIATAHTGSALAVAAIHQNFLDDDGLEPLIDACITSLTESVQTVEEIGPPLAKTTQVVTQSKAASPQGKSPPLTGFDDWCKDKILKDGYVKDRLNNKYWLRSAAPAALNSASLAAIAGLCGPIFQAAAQGKATGEVGQSLALCNQLLRTQMIQAGQTQARPAGGQAPPPAPRART